MKQHGSKMYAIATMVAVALVLVFSFQAAFAAEPINIGFTTDFSGTAATLTMQEAPVVEMVVKEINAAGGIKGRPINLIVQDNASDPAKALGNAKMFKEQYKCKVIIAGVTSSVCLALKNWADQNHIPIIAIDPASDKLLVKSGKAWFFRTEDPIFLSVEAALARLKKLGHTTIAFEGSTLAWGTDTLKMIKEKAPTFGIKVVSEVLIEPKAKDLTIQAKKLKDSGAKAVFIADYESETAALARAMNSLGWKPYVIHVSAANLNSAMSLAPAKMLSGWETLQAADTSKPFVRKIFGKIKAYTGKPVDEDKKVLRAYDAISLLVEALKASGNPEDSTAIRDAFYKLPKYERATGKTGGKGGFVIGKNHLVDLDDEIIYTVKSGKLMPAK
ncbi:ABC transporter substrate-binding protein [Geobacter argillaceus]|uniref:ABC-type branched-subunit amino acid transport system substrate-binding protein n=1 Tax=Geobacter argillaceus TaxID=345631 RepID=A0A562V7X2_9BACT|nr:ABC transporter substrate-binding protein [Geobacter argillaceus]TWJ14006.1 ABC-type branched-subunit amino acid transport system substrate-binding protein [Geobacter argillaceus]